MRSLFWVALATLFLVQAADKKTPRERKLYVGKDSVEATMTFDGSVEFEADAHPSKPLAHQKIEDQLMHLFGPMGEARYYAVPKGDHDVTLGKIEKSDEGTYKVHYKYSGTIVVKVPKKGLRPTYKITLPINPDTIYEAGTVETQSGAEKHPCTDEHYDGEGDFWYFWNPKQTGCPLKEGTDYVRIAAKVKKHDNTRITFPDYARMKNKDGDISMSILIGMDDPEESDRDPLLSTDENAVTYVTIANDLEKKGYSRRLWSREEIRAVADTVRPYPYVEEFEKKFDKAVIRVRLFFGETGIDQKSGPFHYFFRDSLQKDAVMIYDGHSGLGGHLDLATIESLHGFKIQLPKDRYQVYFFNSCSSYSYYNTMYFSRKATDADPRGIKNLEILTNGLATFFTVMHNTNLEVLGAVEAWASGKASVSYQALAKHVDSGNLFGVNGDEDNPKRP